jgi:DegV family protein with EDD domain
MPRVGIVTDSTCDLTPPQLRDLDVRMVPLKVLIGDETYLDWVEMTPDEFYKRLATVPVLPKTSQPTPAEFLSVYRELADEGCESIVSIHLTSELSGTISSATLAADDCPIPVHIVDTKKVSQALGLVVTAACEARDAGGDGSAIASRAHLIAESTRLLFVLDTLDYLVKGGRAGRAQGLAASLLNIKPVLEMNSDGIIEPFKKAKGRKKALVELARHVAEESTAKGTLRVVLLHACGPNEGRDLQAELVAAGVDMQFAGVGLVGAVVGTYTGPDAVGCAYYPLG